MWLPNGWVVEPAMLGSSSAGVLLRHAGVKKRGGDGAVAIVRIHHLGLTVTDADASAYWYSDVLGFHRTGEYTSPDGSRRKVFLGHDRLDVRLGLCQHAGSSGERFDETRPGLDHVSFAVESAAELLDWEQRLQAHGVDYTPAALANTIPGAQILVFRDLDNIQLELIAYR
jgi:glyoxylase I family protein